MANEIEIFGMRVRIVPDEKKIANCVGCSLFGFEICANLPALPCKDASGYSNRHFEEIKQGDTPDKENNQL